MTKILAVLVHPPEIEFSTGQETGPIWLYQSVAVSNEAAFLWFDQINRTILNQVSKQLIGYYI